MAAAAVSADQGKRELEALLTKALEVENVEDMEEIFHTIVDRSNQLRRQYGLPVRMDEKDTTSILKTNLEQLKLVGAESEIVYGSAIMNKASKRTNKTTQPSLFELAFVKKEKATQFQSIIMNNVDHAMSVEKVTIFPPLLLRSTKQGRLALFVDEKNQISDEQSKPNLLFVFSDEGPIVPVVDKKFQARMKHILERVYPLTGLATVANFKDMLFHINDEVVVEDIDD
jgi:hypothetical protein